MNSVQNSYKPYDLNSCKILLSEDEVKSIKNPQYVYQKEERKINKKAIVSICSITGGVTLLTTGFILLQRGKLGGGIDEIKKLLDESIKKLSKKETISGLEKGLLTFYEKSKQMLERLKIFNNVASVKDVPFCKGMKKMKMGGICDKITKAFGNITHNTVNNAYKKTSAAFTNVFEKLAKLDTKTLASKNPADIIEINGVKKTVAEWLKMSSDYQTSIGEALKKGFGTEAHTERFNQLKQSFGNIQEEFWNELFKGQKFKSSAQKLSESFVLEDLAAPKKLDYVTEIYKHKSAITNSFGDRCEQALDTLQSIKIKTQESKIYQTALSEMLGNIKKLIKNPNQNSENILSDIMKQKSELIDKLSKSENFAGKDKIIEAINNSVDNLTATTKKGQLQKLLEIQKGLLPENEYIALEKEVKNAAGRLNKSARLEGGAFVDKIRDISSGSAVTDVLITGMTPVLGTSAAMVMADSKQERRSALLKAGIPLLGGVAVSLSCTAGIIPIGISMILGTVSSIILNKIGKAVNEKLDEKDLIDDLNKKTNTEA